MWPVGALTAPDRAVTASNFDRYDQTRFEYTRSDEGQESCLCAGKRFRDSNAQTKILSPINLEQGWQYLRVTKLIDMNYS